MPNKRYRKAIEKVPIIESTETCRNPVRHRQHIFLVLSLFAMRFLLLLVLLLLNFYSLWYRNNIYFMTESEDLLSNTNCDVLQEFVHAYTHSRTRAHTKSFNDMRSAFCFNQGRKKWKQIKSNRLEYEMGYKHIASNRSWNVKLSTSLHAIVTLLLWRNGIDFIKNCNSLTYILGYILYRMANIVTETTIAKEIVLSIASYLSSSISFRTMCVRVYNTLCHSFAYL